MQKKNLLFSEVTPLLKGTLAKINTLEITDGQSLTTMKSVIRNKRAMMALGLSPEYHWNQIISKSVHWFSRSLFFSIYSPHGHFVQQSRTV